jgi:hypothetical protein
MVGLRVKEEGPMGTLRLLCLSTVLVLSVAFVAGCGKNPTSPGVQPEITNSVDNFQYQVTRLRNYTDTATYHWQNTGATATVNQATTITSGSATLVLLDAGGVEVYSRSLAENGTFASTIGTPGEWTIRATYSAASATVNFRVQKTP